MCWWTADGPLPQPKPGEVLIEVAYAGVNRPDCLQRSGAYPPPADASPIIGLEVAGRIAALGEGVTTWKIGDAVCALTPGGGYAEYCATPAGFCLPVPAGLSLREAAGIPENYFTVWYNVFDRVHLAAGESILIHGGTSGIGLTAIQLAKAFGAIVFTTAGSAEKVAFCTAMGADHAIDYKAQDFVAEVSRHHREARRRRRARHGRRRLRRQESEMPGASKAGLSQIGLLNGSRADIGMHHVMVKRLTVTGSTLRASPVARKVALANSLRDKVWPLFEQRRLKVVIQETLPLARAGDAHALMESGRLIGKVILEVSP